jgi:hypothetical protein
MKRFNIKELGILIKPFVISVIVSVLWVLIYNYIGFNSNLKLDEGIMASGTIALLGVFYALLTAFVFATVWQQWVSIEDAIKTRNKEEFIKHKDKRVPFTVKLLIVIFSFFLIVAFFLISFKNLILGVFSIFVITFILSMYWQVITDLDDPFTGIWNVEVPKEWEKLVKRE